MLPGEAARLCVEQLGFAIDAETPELVSLHGPNINLSIEVEAGALSLMREVMSALSDVADRCLSC